MTVKYIIVHDIQRQTCCELRALYIDDIIFFPLKMAGTVLQQGLSYFSKSDTMGLFFLRK